MISRATDWALVRTGLMAWVALGLGYDSLADQARVQWQDEPRSPVVGHCAMLTHLASRPIGGVAAGYRHDSDAEPGSEIVRSIAQMRATSIQLALDGYDRTLGATGSPVTALERFALSSRSAESTRLLRSLGLSLQVLDGPRSTSRREAGRDFPRAILDLEFVYTSVLERDYACTWIERTVIRTRLRDEAGTTLTPYPPDFVI